MLQSLERLEARVVLSAVGFGLEDIVAMSGDPAPDAPDHADAIFTIFGDNFPAPVLNDAGEAVFQGTSLSLSSFNSNTGLFRGSTESLVPIARSGQSVPQIDGAFSDPGNPPFPAPLLPLNDNGQALFVSGLAGVSDDQDTGLFIGGGTPESLMEVVREGDPAPDVTGSNGQFAEFSASLPPALNSSGQVAFRQVLQNTIDGSHTGIFRADAAGNVARIARVGQPAPINSGTFSSLSNPTLNDAGQVAFAAQVLSGPASSGIFVGDGASPLIIIVESGQTGPVGETFTAFAGNDINNHGEVAFLANYQLPETGDPDGIGGGSDPDGVFVGDGTDITAIARQGQSLADGYVVGNLSALHPVALNDNGGVAFVGFVRPSGTTVAADVALLRGDGDGPPLQIARLGQRVPRDDAVFSSFEEFALNDEGQIAFSAILLDDSGDFRTALFFHDDAAGLIEVARTGDTFEDAEIFTILNFAGGVQDNRDGLNNQGKVAFGFTANLGGGGFGGGVGQLIAVVDPLAMDAEPDPLEVMGQVWLDADANGALDDGEAGMANVTVRLRDAFGGGVLDETVTDDQGVYRLRASAAGEGFVEFVAPERRIYTRRDRGDAGEDRDSDVARGAGIGATDVFGFGGATPAPPQGAGLVPLSETAPSQNPVEPVDVDNNGELSLSDVLVVVSHLRDFGFGALGGEPESLHEFVDVSGDNQRGLDDLLAVVTALREALSGGGFGPAGEGESIITVIAEKEAADAAVHLAPLWPDLDVRERAIAELFKRDEWWRIGNA